MSPQKNQKFWLINVILKNIFTSNFIAKLSCYVQFFDFIHGTCFRHCARMMPQIRPEFRQNWMWPNGVGKRDVNLLLFGIMWINSQSLEDTQVGYISQKYSFDKYILGQAFKPSYTFLSISAFIYIFEHLSLHIHFRAFKPSYTFSSI